MRLLTLPELKTSKGVPFSRQHIYRLVDAGQFPRPIKGGVQRIAFVESEIDQWIELCAARSREAA